MSLIFKLSTQDLAEFGLLRGRLDGGVQERWAFRAFGFPNVWNALSERELESSPDWRRDRLIGVANIANDDQLYRLLIVHINCC